MCLGGVQLHVRVKTAGGVPSILATAALPSGVVAGVAFNLSFSVSSTGVTGGVGVGSSFNVAAVSSPSVALQVREFYHWRADACR